MKQYTLGYVLLALAGFCLAWILFAFAIMWIGQSYLGWVDEESFIGAP